MEINEGLDAIQKSEMIGDDIYALEIVDIREEQPPDGYDESVNGKFVPSWGVAPSEIKSAQDPLNNVPETIGRRVDLWLWNKFGRQGLRLLLEHKVMNDPEGGWEDGIPLNDAGVRDTKNLIGVQYNAKVSSNPAKKDGKKVGGYKQTVRPITW